MARNKRIPLLLGLLGGGGISLPIDIDFSALPDGALPALLAGSTWAVASGKAVNTPTLGANLLTDPGLEANYTTGKCDTLTYAPGSVTYTQSADVHGGSKAQQMVGAAASSGATWNIVSDGVGQWRQFSIWAKRTVGTAGDMSAWYGSAGSQPADDMNVPITSASYQQYKLALLLSNGNIFNWAARQNAAGNPSDTVIVDDGSQNAITYSSLFSMCSAGTPNVVVKANLAAMGDGTPVGLALRGSSVSAPDNCILAMVWMHPLSNLANVAVVKKIGSTYTRIMNATLVNKASDVWFEMRATGTTVQVYYNNAQVGADLTVADAELNGTYHGMFSTGGNNVNRFFVGGIPSVSPYAWAGSSFTAGGGYTSLVQQSLIANYPGYIFTFANGAASGQTTWANLVRMTSDILSVSPVVVVLDHANDPNSDLGKASVEAFIRRVWASNPQTRIILIESPNWILQDTGNDNVVNSPLNTAVLGWIHDIATHYNIPVAAYWEWCKSVVPVPYHLTDLTADTVHPTTLGYTNMARLVEDYVPTGPGVQPVVLPSRLYAGTADYENTPTRTNGTGYDSISGSWTTTGSRIESNITGATVTYAATCQSFGLYRSDGGASSNIDVSIDGGGYSDFNLWQNGTAIIGGLAAHSIVFRVKAGGSVRIDQFWAI
jgi:hypothetical protein